MGDTCTQSPTTNKLCIRASQVWPCWGDRNLGPGPQEPCTCLITVSPMPGKPVTCLNWIYTLVNTYGRLHGLSERMKRMLAYAAVMCTPARERTHIIMRMHTLRTPSCTPLENSLLMATIYNCKFVDPVPDALI